MVERRKPLVLSMTKILLSSVLSSSQLSEVGWVQVVAEDEPLGDDMSGDIQLRAEIIRSSRDRDIISDLKLNSLDDAALVELSTSTLKQLSITSGSLIKKFCFRSFVWLQRKRRKRKEWEDWIFQLDTYQSRWKLYFHFIFIFYFSITILASP